MSKKPAPTKGAAQPAASNKAPNASKTAGASKSSKKEQKGIYTIYKIESDKVVRLRPTCERCGPGYFMADHQERFTCGHCGFTRYKRAQ